MQEPIAPNKNPPKAKKKMHTNLPIQAEPLIEVGNDKKVKLSQLPENHKLFSPRSISQHGRSSEKLKSLRIKLDTIDYYSGRDRLFKLVTIASTSEDDEALESKNRDNLAKGSCQNTYPPSPGQSRSRRRRGRNRYR
ncbi:hypothetical protein LIER_21719 [Lithospermum erythrorhizon]|uniref:Uncharacterized protein n=1 Tax=Lithospermum erythrorhizon TaxID=34254 RepID=A0AAV3QS96_LITER